MDRPVVSLTAVFLKGKDVVREQFQVEIPRA